jgi:hypothetical protein
MLRKQDKCEHNQKIRKTTLNFGIGVVSACAFQSRIAGQLRLALPSKLRRTMTNTNPPVFSVTIKAPHKRTAKKAISTWT